MDFRTIVDIDTPDFSITPCESILCVGSCFADRIGQRFREEKFNALVNPFGVMYNPASIMHTVQRMANDQNFIPNVAVLTLGTNHVYILKETGEIVDNCQKRPQKLFQEKALTVDECVMYLQQSVELLEGLNKSVKVVVTVSPIRYAKYGFHGSALSKATLLLAADHLVANSSGRVTYFPAYEIVNDELRDYRFYEPDMLHPSAQAVEYIWERFQQMFLSDEARRFMAQWKPIKEALGHRPFNPQSEQYIEFLRNTKNKLEKLELEYGKHVFLQEHEKIDALIGQGEAAD